MHPVNKSSPLDINFPVKGIIKLEEKHPLMDQIIKTVHFTSCNENLVEHRQLFGKVIKGKYIEEPKTNYIPLVDESGPNIKTSIYDGEVFEVEDWTESSSKKRKRSIHRADPTLSEKHLTGRKRSKIRKSNSPAWNPNNLDFLREHAQNLLSKKNNDISPKKLASQMLVLNRRSVRFNSAKIREIYKSLGYPIKWDTTLTDISLTISEKLGVKIVPSCGSYQLKYTRVPPEAIKQYLDSHK